MRFIHRRGGRRFERKVGTENFALIGAPADPKRRMTELEAEIERRAPESSRWIRKVETAGLDPYFQAALCLSIVIGATIFADLEWELVRQDDDPSAEADDFVERLRDDRTWRRARGIATWAHVGRFVVLNWPERYEEAMNLAAVALGEPTDEQADIVLLAGQVVGEDHGARFHAALIHVLVATVVGQPNNDLEDELARPWAAAWAKSRAFFWRQLDDNFPDGQPAD
jgi:hypothetical protein